MRTRCLFQDLSAFQTWRREQRNDQAYREVEAMWGRGEALRADPEIARVLAAALKSASVVPATRRRPAWRLRPQQPRSCSPSPLGDVG